MALSTKKISGEDSVHYIPPRKKRGPAKPKMQPPLTPMIDVTFQLLLFFLLTFTFRQAEGLIPGSLPRGDLGTPDQRKVLDPIEITVRQPSFSLPDKAVFEIRHEHVPLATAMALFKRLEDLRRVRSPETPVVIHATTAVRWEHVVDVFNQAVQARFEKIGFAGS